MVLCGLLLLAMSTSQGARAGDAAQADTPTATRTKGQATVGPLYPGGTGTSHTCTAAVLDSPHGNLLLTAAHCVAGDASGMVFAPGYLRGSTPYGVWTVQRAWAAPTWLANQDPTVDLAVLQVADQDNNGTPVTLQSVTGGLPVGQTNRTSATRTVTTVGYQNGSNDAPVSCTAVLTSTQGYPTFTCHGYADGTSGSPFLWSDQGRAPVLLGVLGGLHQGGCQEWQSFSSPLTVTVYQLLARAINDLPADALPAAGPDGC